MKKYRILIICIVILIACWVFAQPPIQPILDMFLDHSDTPGTYTGQDGKYVKVDETNLQLIFGTPAGAGDLLADGTVPLTANWDVGNFDITLKSLTGDGTIEGATITEGGQAVWNAAETDILDSGHYIAGSIDYEHLAEDVVSGAAAVGTFESGDTFLILEAGVGLREADFDDIPSSLTEEEVEDFVGGMLGGTETHIAVTYEDGTNDIDFIVDPDSVAGSISAGAYNDNSVNNADINWADIDNLGDEGVVTLAGLATKLTITDNESTAENNPIVFVAGADPDGGDLDLETDGDLHYNPSTGLITATGFVGALTGNASTATLAATVTYADNESTNENNAIVFLPGGDLDGGNLAPEVDGDFHYNPSTGLVTATAFAGDLTGAVTGNADTATLAATVTYADNESTAENNAIVFLPGGDLDGGNLAPEVDGDFHYNPSTGTVTATEFSGGGGSLTGVDAVTGDSATDFFDAGAFADARIPNNITIDLATLATTVTVSDDESTDDDQEIVFTTDNTNLESDGDFHYSPDTGTVTAPEFVGGGAGIASVDAITGDSATAFFDAGTIEHEWGGLQADISGYTGLIAITGADTTVEIDSLDELEGQLADVTRIVTEAVMPVASADPDVDAAGELSVDTDGGDEPNSITLRTFMGTDDQAIFSDTLKHYSFSIAEPDNLAEADFHPVWKNRTGFTFIITAIHGESDIDNFDFTLKERDADGANVTAIEAVQLTTDGTAMYYGSVVFADIDHTTIEAGHTIGFDKSADDAKYVLVVFSGYYEADVD